MIRQSTQRPSSISAPKEIEEGYYPLPSETSRGDGVTVYNRAMNLQADSQVEIGLPRVERVVTSKKISPVPRTT